MLREAAILTIISSRAELNPGLWAGFSKEVPDSEQQFPPFLPPTLSCSFSFLLGAVMVKVSPSPFSRPYWKKNNPDTELRRNMQHHMLVGRGERRGRAAGSLLVGSSASKWAGLIASQQFRAGNAPDSSAEHLREFFQAAPV